MRFFVGCCFRTLQALEQYRWLKLSFVFGSLMWTIAAFSLPFSSDKPESILPSTTDSSEAISPHIYHATWLLHHEKLSYLMSNLLFLPLLIILLLHVQAPKSSTNINYLVQLLQPFASIALLVSFYFPSGDYNVS